MVVVASLLVGVVLMTVRFTLGVAMPLREPSGGVVVENVDFEDWWRERASCGGGWNCLGRKREWIGGRVENWKVGAVRRTGEGWDIVDWRGEV